MALAYLACLIYLRPSPILSPSSLASRATPRSSSPPRRRPLSPRLRRCALVALLCLSLSIVAFSAAVSRTLPGPYLRERACVLSSPLASPSSYLSASITRVVSTLATAAYRDSCVECAATLLASSPLAPSLSRNTKQRGTPYRSPHRLSARRLAHVVLAASLSRICLLGGAQQHCFARGFSRSLSLCRAALVLVVSSSSSSSAARRCALPLLLLLFSSAWYISRWW